MLRFAYYIQRANLLVKRASQSVFFIWALLAIGVFFLIAWKVNRDVYSIGLWVVLWITGLIMFLEALSWLISTYAKDNENFTVLPGKKVRKKNKDGLVLQLSEDLVEGDAFNDIDIGGMGGDGD